MERRCRGMRGTGTLTDHPQVLVATVGVAIGIGVCWPMLGDHPVFLLDWVIGPRPPLPTPSMLGLDGGLLTGSFSTTAMGVLVRVVGEAATWIPLFAVFPVAAVGIGRLVGGRWWMRAAAATLYCVNPWVFNRVYAGDVPLLLGYALLPFAVVSALRATEPTDRPAQRPNRRRHLLVSVVGPSLWWVLLTALTPHFAWIYGAVLAVVVAVTRGRRWLVAWGAGCAACFALMSTYILLPHSAATLPTTVGNTTLGLYRTAADPRLGLFPNVAGLYGFWRTGPGPVLPKQEISGWPLLMAAILLVVAGGFWAVLRRRPSEDGPPRRALGSSDGADPGAPLGNRPGVRRLAWVVLGVGVLGYFLALGSRGPTGLLFRWAYHTVPFFDVMREPQKFLMLTALAYAAGFAWGVERLRLMAAPRWGTVAAVAVGMALPLAYTPTIFDGLGGQIGPSTLPAAYGAADRAMGSGTGQVLYLPWHDYEVQPFTTRRVVASVGPTTFRRPVLAGSDVQSGGVETQSTSPQSAYLDGLLARRGSQTRLGAALAPLGVEYVVLAKTADWRSYGWLDRQDGLHRILDGPTLEVWRNRAYRGVGYRTGSQTPVHELSPIAFKVPPGTPGRVVIDAAYQPGWVLDSRPGRPGPGGSVEFRVGRRGGIATFQPWGLVKLGAAISGGTFGVLWLGLCILRRRLRRPVQAEDLALARPLQTASETKLLVGGGSRPRGSG